LDATPFTRAIPLGHQQPVIGGFHRKLTNRGDPDVARNGAEAAGFQRSEGRCALENRVMLARTL